MGADSKRGGIGYNSVMNSIWTPESWRVSGSWLNFQDLRLFVTDQGRGRPLLLLHGFPTSSYDYTRVVPLLAEHFRLVLFDYPGFGFSGKPRSHRYSLLECADAVQMVAEIFHLDPLLILAHDISDSVVLELLRRGTPAIAGLIMMNGSVWSIPFTDLKLLLMQRVMLHPLLGLLISRLHLFRRPIFANMMRQIFFAPLSDAEIDAFWSLLQFNNGIAIYHLLLGYMRERWQHQVTWLNALQASQVPLTLVWGQDDPVATPAVAEIIMARRPDATSIRLARVGHYPHWEAPEYVAAAVLRAFT